MQRTKPLFAQFAVWLILFQLLTPIAYAGFDITTICSSDGIKQITMDANGTPVELPSAQNHCELCILYSSNAATTLANSNLLVQMAERNDYVTLYRSPYAHLNSSLGFSSRAPPTYS